MKNTNLFIDHIKELLLIKKEVSIKASGDSMLPLIRGDRDIVLIKSIKFDELSIGDIVLFKYNNELVVHRVISIDDKIITLRGDGNKWGVEKCLFEDLIGKVFCIKRGRFTVDCESILSRTFKIIWCSNNRLRVFLLTLYKYLIKYM